MKVKASIVDQLQENLRLVKQELALKDNLLEEREILFTKLKDNKNFPAKIVQTKDDVFLIL